MPKPGWLSMKIEKPLEEQVKAAAEEDDRTYSDEIRYLLRLGLRAREHAKAIEARGALGAGAEAAEGTLPDSGKRSNAAGAK